jgi:predicted Zn-dependent peptidase
MIAHSKLAFETTAAHAAWAGEGVMDFGRIPPLTEWRQSVLAVTAADVHAIAREIFHNQPHATAEIGPANC